VPKAHTRWGCAHGAEVACTGLPPRRGGAGAVATRGEGTPRRGTTPGGWGAHRGAAGREERERAYHEHDERRQPQLSSDPSEGRKRVGEEEEGGGWFLSS
jgi:hypothetical protein